jgi:cysteine desulfuration protein SufE
LESAVIDQEATIVDHDIIDAQRRIVEVFEFVDGWIERYETLIDLGRRLAPMPASLRNDRNRIRTCRGDAWLAGIRRDGRLYLSAASETGVLAGLLAIIVEVYSGRAAEDVLHHPLVVLETTGLSQRLSPHRPAACREILVRLRELAS